LGVRFCHMWLSERRHFLVRIDCAGGLRRPGNRRPLCREQ
jgi:hypothetical protein